jgi:hypothetical protein
VTTTYFPGGSEGYKVLADYPMYAISEMGVIRALGNTSRTTYGEVIPQTNGRVFLYQFDEQGNWQHRIIERASQLYHEAYSDGMGAGVQVPEKKKITIEIEDPEKALRILDRLYPRDWGIQDVTHYEVYGWMKNITEQIQNAMKEGSPNDGRQQGLASNT